MLVALVTMFPAVRFAFFDLCWEVNVSLRFAFFLGRSLGGKGINVHSIRTIAFYEWLL